MCLLRTDGGSRQLDLGPAHGQQLPSYSRQNHTPHLGIIISVIKRKKGYWIKNVRVINTVLVADVMGACQGDG